jgi:hypothetical protein
MDPAGDIIQVNPSAGSRDTVPSSLGIGSIFNVPLKDVPIRSRCLPQLFATAKIYHVGAANAVMVERYSHEGYLVKVVVMALAGEVTRELSPILSWSNNNHEI